MTDWPPYQAPAQLFKNASRVYADARKLLGALILLSPTTRKANGTTVPPYAATSLLLPLTPAVRTCHCTAAFVASAGSLLPPGLSSVNSLSSFSETLGSAEAWAGQASVGFNSLLAPLPIPDWVACYPWVLDYVKYASFAAAAALCVILVNSGLVAALDALGSVARPLTTDTARVAAFFRKVVLRCFNTGLLVILVSAYIPTLPVDTPGVKYSDFSNGWYTNKAPPLIIMMVLQAFVPPLGALAGAACWRARRASACAPLCCVPRFKTQAAAAAWFTPPTFDLASRYADHVTLVAVCVVYSTGLPLLTLLCAASFALHFAVDGALFLFHYAPPPRESSRLGVTALGVLPVVLALHGCVGAWMLSSASLFAVSAGATLPGYGSAALSSVVSRASGGGPGRALLQLAPGPGAINFSAAALDGALVKTLINASATLAAAEATATFSYADFTAELGARVSIAYVAPLAVCGILWALWVIFAQLFAAYLLAPAAFAAASVARPARRIAAHCARSCCGGPLPQQRGQQEQRRRQRRASGGCCAGGGASTPPAVTDIGGGDLATFEPVLKWLPIAGVRRAAAEGGVLPAAQVEAILRAEDFATDADAAPVAVTVVAAPSPAPRVRGGSQRRGAATPPASPAATRASAAAREAVEEAATRRASCALCALKTVLSPLLCWFSLVLWCALVCRCRCCGARGGGGGQRDSRGRSPGGGSRRDSLALRSPRSGRRRSESRSGSERGGTLNPLDARSGSGARAREADAPAREQLPPLLIYCCGGDWDVGASFRWLLPNCCARHRCCGGSGVAAGDGTPPGALAPDGRRILLPPPHFSTALACRLLSGAPTYNPLSSRAVLAQLLPQLVHRSGTLFLQHKTVAGAAVFGYAKEFPDDGRNNGWEHRPNLMEGLRRPGGGGRELMEGLRRPDSGGRERRRAGRAADASGSGSDSGERTPPAPRSASQRRGGNGATATRSWSEFWGADKNPRAYEP